MPKGKDYEDALIPLQIEMVKLQRWTVVNSNVQKLARLESMRHVLNALPYDHKDPEVAHAADPRVVQLAVQRRGSQRHVVLGLEHLGAGGYGERRQTLAEGVSPRR